MTGRLANWLEKKNPTSMARTCQRPNCDRKCYGDYCLMHKPRKALPRATKPIAKVGKAQKATNAAVAAWKRDIQPNHQGYYKCYIGGDRIDYLTAEHPYSKTRHPELRTTQKFEPVCNEHNALKGSLDIDEFLEKYPQFKATVKREYLT
jgi:hypothetical protein